MGNRHTQSANIHTDAILYQRKHTMNQSKSLPSIPTLQYTITITNFNNLNMIDISSSKISNIDFIPFGLVQLNCRNNKLLSLPKLPYTLERLDCSDNKLSGTLELPDNLTIVRCHNNKINNIITVRKINDIICDINACPDNLIELNCHTNEFKELPKLNNELEYLFCENIGLKILPSLPTKLKQVDFKIIKTARSYEIEWSGTAIHINEKEIDQMNGYIKKMNKST